MILQYSKLNAWFLVRIVQYRTQDMSVNKVTTYDLVYRRFDF